jgi:hypothetical protein
MAGDAGDLRQSRAGPREPRHCGIAEVLVALLRKRWTRRDAPYFFGMASLCGRFLIENAGRRSGADLGKDMAISIGVPGSACVLVDDDGNRPLLFFQSELERDLGDARPCFLKAAGELRCLADRDDDAGLVLAEAPAAIE